MQDLNLFSAGFSRLLLAPGFSRWEKGISSQGPSRLQPGFSTRFSKRGDESRAEACREAALKRAIPREKENLIPTG
jgi:hypothetical protein